MGDDAEAANRAAFVNDGETKRQNRFRRTGDGGMKLGALCKMGKIGCLERRQKCKKKRETVKVYGGACWTIRKYRLNLEE